MPTPTYEHLPKERSMVWLLTIRPAGNREAAAARIWQQAKADPKIVIVSRDSSNHVLYFCDSPGEAEEQRQRYAQYRSLRPSLCSLTMSDKSITADQTGDDDSQHELAAFLRWIFKTFAPCDVFDGESGDDLSAIAQVNPALLIGPDPSTSEAV
jgi:hypothetical protein